MKKVLLCLMGFDIHPVTYETETLKIITRCQPYTEVQANQRFEAHTTAYHSVCLSDGVGPTGLRGSFKNMPKTTKIFFFYPNFPLPIFSNQIGGIKNISLQQFRHCFTMPPKNSIKKFEEITHLNHVNALYNLLMEMDFSSGW